MNSKLLYFFVEGADDERFFENIIKPEFEKKHYVVKIYKHSQKQNNKIEKFLNGIKAMGSDYIYVTDIDHTSCITSKKKKIENSIKGIDINKIIVVIKEIESWYLAGLDKKNSKKLKIDYFDTTNHIIKEKFNDLIPKKYDSRIDFLMEILKYFSMDSANQKNTSFKYFFEKYNRGN